MPGHAGRNCLRSSEVVGTARCAVRRMSPQRATTDPRTPQRGVPTRPIRKRLPHEVPLWVHPDKEDYFITACCAERESNQLANPRIAPSLIDTIKHRNERQIWYTHLAVIMPDHVHLIVSFGRIDTPIQTVVSKWKEWTAKSFGIRWQRDFFEHRLRQEEGFREKAAYVFANPARAGLVKQAEDWPYTFIAERW
jgi:putative transposase